MTTTLLLPKWYDLHVHMRQGDLLEPLIEQHLGMGCAGILAMPNTVPPVEKVFDDEPGDCLSIASYRAMLLSAGGDAFADIICPLYLSPSTTPRMIERGARNGILRACKYYPPHATTNSEDSADIAFFMKNGVIKAMQDNNIVLCLHGERHDLAGETYFGRNANAETSFYQNEAPRLVDAFPGLRMVFEHLSSKAGVDFVKRTGTNVAASITPQHLLYTIGHLLQGLKYHLYCLPVVKFQEDTDALRKAVTSPGNHKFFAGTDSAPHTNKITPCCGAAGCFIGGVAPQLYAEAFEKAGLDMDALLAQEIFKRFLCLNGPTFYGLKVPEETFALTRKPQEVSLLSTPAGTLTPLPVGMWPVPTTKTTLSWSVEP